MDHVVQSGREHENQIPLRRYVPFANAQWTDGLAVFENNLPGVLDVGLRLFIKNAGWNIQVHDKRNDAVMLMRRVVVVTPLEIDPEVSQTDL